MIILVIIIFTIIGTGASVNESANNKLTITLFHRIEKLLFTSLILSIYILLLLHVIEYHL